METNYNIDNTVINLTEHFRFAIFIKYNIFLKKNP